MERKYNYVYITTNLVNGKQYVGDHSTDNLNDSYLGSGLLIQKSISKYGRKNFKREILELCESKEEAFNLQEKYINEYNTLFPNGYNISPKGGHNISGCISEETKKKISNSEKGKILSEETKKKISIANKGKQLSDEHKKKLLLVNKGKKKSKETKELISNSKKGKSPNFKNLDHNGDKNPMYGKKHSEEAKKKMSEKKKGYIPWNKGIKQKLKNKK